MNLVEKSSSAWLVADEEMGFGGGRTQKNNKKNKMLEEDKMGK
jgi:hypothetical protein